MSQQQCTNCRIPLDRDDVFCGNCGTPVIRPAASGQRAAGGAGADPGHPAADIADAVPWTQTTRSESIWRDTGATPGPDLGADQGRGTSDGTHRKPRGRASSAAADPFFRHAAQLERGPHQQLDALPLRRRVSRSHLPQPGAGRTRGVAARGGALRRHRSGTDHPALPAGTEVTTDPGRVAGRPAAGPPGIPRRCRPSGSWPSRCCSGCCHACNWNGSRSGSSSSPVRARSS